jgi:thymidylate synthase (FAD)
LDVHAQWEIRQYAEVIAGMVKQWVPQTWDAFRDFRLLRTELSAPATGVVKRWLAGENVIFAESGLSQREWTALCESFGRKK